MTDTEPFTEPPGEKTAREEADDYRALGMERQRQGDLDDAAAYYQISLELFPTAEAHTALGVTYAARGNWEEALGQCDRALALDPELGNAWNDRGVYLAELGRREEAMESFDRAIAAPRYDCRHYPYYHKGRLLEQVGRFGEARNAYEASYNLAPDWPPSLIGYRRALSWLN